MTRIDLDNYQYIRVSGPDATQFLQGQLSCNLELLAPDRSLRGALCNLKGRVIADLRILLQGQDCLMQTAGGMADSVLTTLSRYAVFSKVELTLETPHRPAIGFIGNDGNDGSDGEDQLLALFGSLPQQTDQVVQIESASLIKIAGTHARYELWFQGSAGVDLQQQSIALEQLQAIPVGSLHDWEREDLLAGIIHITPALSEEHTPQLLNYDIGGIIDFSKGCYTGQEVVARMHYRGKAKKRLYLLNSEQEISTDSRVLQLGTENPKPLEILAFNNAGAADANGNLLLAVLGNEAVSSGSKFSLSDQTDSSLEILSLPSTP